MIVDYSFKVRWGDTDAAGIVFYPNFYKWMDEATHEFLASHWAAIFYLVQ